MSSSTMGECTREYKSFLPACLLACLPICLSICLPVCLSVYGVCSRNACCCTMCHAHLPSSAKLAWQTDLLVEGMPQAGSRTGSALHHLHELKYCPLYIVLSDPNKSHDLHTIVKLGTLQLLLVSMLASLLCRQCTAMMLCIVCNYSTAFELDHV